MVPRTIDDSPHRAVATVVAPVGAVVLPRKVIVAEPVLLIATVGTVVTVTPGKLAAESNLRIAMPTFAMPFTS